MEQLTAQQAKMVIEYFAQQAAEDAPRDTPYVDWENHVWRTRMHASVAIDRHIQETDWLSLLSAELDLQSFDRDPDAFLYEHGWEDYADGKNEMDAQLKDRVSLCIDNCFANSGA